jgi:hypothetical protein
MKQLWRLLINKLKNEPVLLVAFIAIVAQAGQRAFSEGHFTFTLWMTYVFQMVMASIARELVTPYAEHLKTLAALGKDAEERAANSYVRGKIDGGGQL